MTTNHRSTFGLTVAPSFSMPEERSPLTRPNPARKSSSSLPMRRCRRILMANDNGGVHSPKWRTHEPVRMVTAKGDFRELIVARGVFSYWREQQ